MSGDPGRACLLHAATLVWSAAGFLGVCVSECNRLSVLVSGRGAQGEKRDMDGSVPFQCRCGGCHHVRGLLPYAGQREKGYDGHQYGNKHVLDHGCATLCSQRVTNGGASRRGGACPLTVPRHSLVGARTHAGMPVPWCVWLCSGVWSFGGRKHWRDEPKNAVRCIWASMVRWRGACKRGGGLLCRHCVVGTYGAWPMHELLCELAALTLQWCGSRPFRTNRLHVVAANTGGLALRSGFPAAPKLAVKMSSRIVNMFPAMAG